MKQDKNSILKDYIENAIIQGSATLDGDYKICNKAVKKLNKIYKLMELDNDLAIEMINTLFKDSNLNVKLWIASHALGLNIKTSEAIATLEEISAQKEAGILSFDAEMTLQTYAKQGYLKFY
jgi:hypothetical protein